MRFPSVPLTLLLLAAGLTGCAADQASRLPDYGAVVAAPDRSDADRQTDQRRNPRELLAFTGARPGMRVLDMGAGGGYSTELLARAVSPGGLVYAQDPPGTVEKMKPRFDARMRGPAGNNIVRVARSFDDPAPAEVRANLDLITFFFAYHDTAFMNVDRAKMNSAMFQALKPGGVLVIADHAALPGAGISAVRSLHRIEETVVRRELEAAGFKLVGEGRFLRSPDDPRNAPVFRSAVPVDEFVLKFEKPRVK
jgi:predicted methyltransferase